MSSSSFSRSTYQPQLRHQHLYDSTISKQHVLAKYWIESILGHRLPSSDLYICLRDGFYLCKIIHIIRKLPTQDNYQLPEDRIQHFLKSAQEFGLQSSDLFNVHDLMNGEDMNSVVSSILILAHTYSCKIFAGKSSSSTKPLPKRSQSYSFDLVKASSVSIIIPSQPSQPQQPEHIKRSKSETLIYNNNMKYQQQTYNSNSHNGEQGFTAAVPRDENNKNRRDEEQEEHVDTSSSRKDTLNTTNEHHYYNHKVLPHSPHTKWDPPFDIQRPNCVPAYGPYSIDKFINEEEDEDNNDHSLLSSSSSPVDSMIEEEDMYNTKKSNAPSSSGDSGYGTTAVRNNTNNGNNKVQDLFEALFAPVAPPPTTKPSPPSLKIKKTSSSLSTVSHSGTNSKLSLLFSKKKEPHYVKFQTWSNNHQSSTTITNLSTTTKKNKTKSQQCEDGSVSSRPYEETFFKKSIRRKSNAQAATEEQEAYENQVTKLPPIIKVEKEHPKQTSSKTIMRSRRKTDASLTPPTSIPDRQQTSSSVILTSTTKRPQHQSHQHVLSKSIGTTLDFESIDPTAGNILEQFDEGGGNLIARYRLGNVIGKGHFGTVYRALDLMSGKTVAIKQINLKDAKKSDIEDMMQEAQLLSSLTHTNIVKYEGFIQTHEYMNIILEYVENGSLLNTLKSFGNALPEHLVASYCHHILKGLAYLHERDVVHCDLKAANILTTKAGHVKLSDFGVSLNLKLKNHEDEDENLVSGTPFWMSPEVIELKGASVQSDIWSLGCTVIELCTGKPPYADLITMTAMFKIVEDESPPLPNDISDDLLNFLKLCFKKNPNERPTAQMLLHHPWITEFNNKTSPTATIKIPKKSNSTILNHYLRKTVEKDDMITLDSIDTNMKLISPPSTAPYYSSPISTSNHKQSSPPPLIPPHYIPPTTNTNNQYDLPTFQSKKSSLFADKYNSQRYQASGLARQSMPALALTSKLHQQQQEQELSLSHVHNLIECSFPKGAGQCKVCSNHIKHDALVCKDFCGYICHKQCKAVINNFGRRRASDGPKPMSSVSSQLREKFSSFSSRKLISKDLTHIMEDHPSVVKVKSSTSSWWKKKS